MQNGVHRGKKPEQSTNLNENISEATVFIKDVQNTVTSCHNFQEYSE